MEELGHVGAQFLRFIMGAWITVGVVLILAVVLTFVGILIETLRKRRR